MKLTYEQPKLEIIALEMMDVIITSGEPGDNEGPGMPGGDD